MEQYVSTRCLRRVGIGSLSITRILFHLLHICITFPLRFISNFLYINTKTNRNTHVINEPSGNIATISSKKTNGSSGKAYTAGIRMPTMRNRISIKIISNSVTNIHESIAKYNIVPTVADIVNTSPCLNAIFPLYIGF